MSAPPARSLTSGDFTGRDDELTLLRNLLAELAGGAGGAVLVEGEQGTGKSALLRRVLADAGGAGFRLAWAASDELGQRIPLLLIRECLGAAGDPGAPVAETAVAGPLPPGDPVLAETERLLADVERLCARSPVVLVAEDLQWADEASLVAWQRLARATGQLPLLLAGTYRPAPAREELSRLRSELLASGGTLLSLSPRPPAAAGAAAAGPAKVPAAGRLSALPADTVTVLRWAAVLGPEFRASDLEMVTGRSAADLAGVLDLAVARGVLTEAGAKLAFRDRLTRGQLYAGGPPARLLHAQAARALAAAGAPKEQVAAQLARGPEAAAGWVPQWLAGALPVLAYRMPRVARQLLRGAIAALPEGDPQREPLQAGLVMVAFLLGQYDEVQQAGRLLLAGHPDPDRGAEVAWLMAYSLLRAGQPAQAVTALESALGQPGVNETWSGRLRALQALMLTMTRRLDEAAEAALAVGQRVADPFTTGYALHARSHLSFVGRDLPGALTTIDRALTVIGNGDQTTDLRLMLLANRVAALGLLDRHDEAVGAATHALVVAERAGTSRLTVLRCALAHQHFEAGQWDDALAELEPAAAGDAGAGSSLAHGLIALIAGYRDDGDAAEAHLAAVSEQGTQAAAAAGNGHYLHLARAVAAERAGRPEAAVAALAACLAPGAARGMPARHLLLPALVRLALAAGDAGTAAAAARAAADEAEREPLPVKGAVADHCRGLLTADLAPVLAAAAYHGSAGRPLRRAEALTDAAVLLASQGGAAPAGDWLDEAVGLYRGMAARWAVRSASARLRGYGIHPRPSVDQADGQARPVVANTAPRPGSLTATEAKIARLVADGRSNPEIAAELSLARSTVRAHVARIVAKCGARSRAGIAASVAAGR